MLFLRFFAQNIDCGYTEEPPCQCEFNEYPQSIFWINKRKKNRYTPINPSLYTERQKKPDTYIWIHNRKTRCAIKYRFIQHGRQIISTPFGCKNPRFQLIPFL